MQFWKQKPQRRRIETSGAFRLGDTVRHKLSDQRLVIVGFDADKYGPTALCAFGWKPGEESEFHLAELTALELPPSPAAVDPVGELAERDPTTRAPTSSSSSLPAPPLTGSGEASKK